MEQACKRLLLLIATFLKYPGVGCPNGFESEKGKHYDAIAQVQKRFQELAKSLNIQLPPGYPAIPTLRKDLNTFSHCKP